MRPQYWFYLEPYTYAVVKGDRLLLYNTLNGTHIEETGRPELLRLVKRLTCRKNMLVVPLSGADLDNEHIAGFLAGIRERFMGDVIKGTAVRGKPVQIPPEVKMMKKPEINSPGESADKGYQLLKNLAGLTLYLNNVPVGSARFPGDAYRQFIAPYYQPYKKGDSTRQLELTGLLAFLEEAKTSLLEQVNILGGDIFQYPHLSELIDALKPLPVDKSYYIHYSQLSGPGAGDLDRLSGTGEQDSLNVFVDLPARLDSWEECRQKLAGKSLRHRFQFIIPGPEEYDQAQQIIATYGIRDFSFVPYYNGRNLEFFQSAVFIDRGDILEGQLPMRKIQIRGMLNPLHYGQLTVMSNGSIYANIHESPIGKLGKDSLYDTLHKALLSSKTWYMYRSKVAPCKHCVFQALCPPISNYEYALGRYNLCHVEKECVGISR